MKKTVIENTRILIASQISKKLKHSRNLNFGMKEYYKDMIKRNLKHIRELEKLKTI